MTVFCVHVNDPQPALSSQLDSVLCMPEWPRTTITHPSTLQSSITFSEVVCLCDMVELHQLVAVPTWTLANLSFPQDASNVSDAASNLTVLSWSLTRNVLS